jgi:UDP-glucose 4-epimerase
MSRSLEGATVLVTGGAGLIGSHTIDLLVEEGVAEVRVFGRRVRERHAAQPGEQSRTSIVPVMGDIRDRAVVARAVAGCEYVFHLVAIRNFLCAEQPRECVEVMVNGTFNVFEAGIESRVEKIVYASSASVYGAADVFPIDERHHPYNNRTLYGAAKVMNEGIARSFHDMYGLPAVGLRYFNVYGPRMNLTGADTAVLVRWLDCIDRGVPPRIHGDGSASLDYVYAGDVARANVLALRSDRTDDVYNVGSGTETTLLDLWQTMQRVTGAFHLSPTFHPLRKVDPVPRRVADMCRARRDLGFVAEVSLEEGLRRLVTWRQETLAHRDTPVGQAPCE